MLSKLISFSITIATVRAVSLTVAGSGGNATSPYQYGLIFEDINRSGDGGIYAELIQNRAFQAISTADATIEPWVSVNGATLSLSTDSPLSDALPNSVQVSVDGLSGDVGLSNPGYFGIDVAAQQYSGSFFVSGDYNSEIKAGLVSDVDGTTLGTTTINVNSTNAAWKEVLYSISVTTAAANTNNSLVITFDASEATAGYLRFNLLSLFPPTYNDTPNGNRIDIMNTLKSMNPSFLRFPGGNNLEGDLSIGASRWIWNNTVGSLKDRPGRLGDWTYYNTDGLGLNEYFQWCSDLGMEPILAVWSGHYLDGTSISQSEIDVYVQDALNEVEYLIGDASTTYGAMRVADGYADPWSLKYVEIGNEDHLSSGLDTYAEYRFQAFYSAFRTAYPNITVISSTTEIEYASDAIGDYHQYTTPDVLAGQFNFFDNNSSKILVGEVAVWEYPNGTRATFPYWQGSVAEAVFFIGLERNSDSIVGATYAPILQNVADTQWTPDLVSFSADPSATIASTSLQVLSLLSNIRITGTLPVNSTDGFAPAYWVAGMNDKGKGVLKAAVYAASSDIPFNVAFEDTKEGDTATVTVLSAPDPFSAVTSSGNNPVVSDTATLTADSAGSFSFTMPTLSVAVLVVD